ncbi:hypothetical protein RIF29_14974 [Crotalaria pallida]|uniref:NAF domain-containing protein n=1 Tax=Crotalaria pallida TaxID=3830 RepID=A0AAN9IC73_CROPI
MALRQQVSLFTANASALVSSSSSASWTCDTCVPVLDFSIQLHLAAEIDVGFKRETRFTWKSSAIEIINKIEEAAKPLRFDVQNKKYKINKPSPVLRLANVKAGRKGNLNVATKLLVLLSFPSSFPVVVPAEKSLPTHSFKITTFQRVDFNEEDIVPLLTNREELIMGGYL